VAMVQTPPLQERSEPETGAGTSQADTAPAPGELPVENLMARDLKRHLARIG
jgi:hypothetical protein